MSGKEGVLCPFKDHTQSVLWGVGKHGVDVLAIFGFGGVGDEVFNGEFALGHQGEHKVTVAFFVPGVVDVGLVGGAWLHGA